VGGKFSLHSVGQPHEVCDLFPPRLENEVTCIECTIYKKQAYMGKAAPQEHAIETETKASNVLAERSEGMVQEVRPTRQEWVMLKICVIGSEFEDGRRTGSTRRCLMEASIP